MLFLYLILTIWQVLPIYCAPFQGLDIEPFLPSPGRHSPREAAPPRRDNNNIAFKNPYLQSFAPIGTRTPSIVPSQDTAESSASQPQIESPGSESSSLTINPISGSVGSLPVPTLTPGPPLQSGFQTSTTAIVRPPQTGRPASSYHEGYSPVAVITVTHSGGTDQVLPPYTGPLPNSSGSCISSLQTDGRPTCQPIITDPIPVPGTGEAGACCSLGTTLSSSLIDSQIVSINLPSSPLPVTSSVVTTQLPSSFVSIVTTRPTPTTSISTQLSSSPSSAPAISSPSQNPSQSVSSVIPPPTPTTTAQTTAMPSSPAGQKDIFAAPIASNAPSNLFPIRNDHPVPRKGIKSSLPVGTNKFYGNFYLGNQNSPTFVHPYSVAWAKGQGATSSWGMCVSHVEADQRVFGDQASDTGAAKYFLNPIGIQSLCLSAVELGANTALTTDNLKAQSANVNLHTDPNATPMITFPLVQGMGFVTAVYNSGTPVISTGILFKIVTRSNKSPKPGVTKYTMHLENGKVWHVYAYAQKGDPLDLQVVNNGLARSTKPFTGFIQVAKDPGNAETIIDSACAAYPVGVTLSGTANSNRGTYTFKYEKGGDQNTRLLMYALPHHIASFDQTTTQAVRNQVRLQTTTKGLATAVISDTWTMVEPNMPVSMDFAPWDPNSGPKRTLRDSAIQTIRPVALKEITQNMDQQTNQESMYFGGKALAKFASICYTVNDLLKDRNVATTGLNNLKDAFARFTQNRQRYPLYYENAWGGIVSSATYTTGNNGADFGNTFYNDHHFHYGYHILTAAIIGYLDPSWLTKANVDYINTLVRDIANPSTKDKYFPVSRNFDWYHGHSWAHGLYEAADGKDQESSSEDAMHAYAIKMWGKTIKDSNMEARGNLMLSIISRSLNHYYLYMGDNTVQPPQFIGNKVAGILFENKVDHTTYFGANIEYIQGIHMLPLLPSTKFTRPAQFVREEWSKLFDNGRVDNIEGGWRGILYGNLATVDTNSAWNFFTRKDFNPSWIDGGASLTWYQAYTAGKIHNYIHRPLGEHKVYLRTYAPKHL